MNKFNKKLNRKKAFTLIEVIIAMGIFTIVMGGSAGVFASAFKSYKASKNVNENVKNAQYAMSLMAKTFRTSSVMAGSNASMLDICDYSQTSCFRYQFNAGTLTRDTASQVFDANNICTCGVFTGAPLPIATTTGIVNGAFEFTPSSGVESTGESTTVGKVTVRMDITSGTGSESSIAKLQSTVSLRDYQTSNIGIDPNNDPN